MVYETFELRIQPGPNRRPEALVTRAPAGDARAELDLPLTDAELSAFLQQTVGVTRNVGLATQTAPLMDVRDFGAQLYQAAFGGAVGTCLMRSLDLARQAGTGLRIRLRIDDRLPELADLPWEYLYAPELQRFLVLSDDTPLVRYLEVPQAAPLQPVSPPLVVLAVLANPRGVQPLAVEREWARLQEATAGLGDSQVRLERIVATWPALQGRLRQGPAHVVHFVGHGYFDADANQGGLLFEDEQGRAVRLAAERFKVLLHDREALRLVFLNACEGARGGRSDSFAGVAQQLVQQAVPAVVAMQFPVTDRAAIALSREFYRALAAGYPLEVALSEARKALFGLGDGLEWGTPVLFSRSDDNRLIELAQGDHRAVIDRQAFEPESIYIPAGPCWLGSDDPAVPAAERPLHRVDLPAYRIGRYPVTVRQYAVFVRERREQPAPPRWFNRQPPDNLLDHPIVDVSWRDAVAYCVWLSQQTGRRYTLPSEAEWEKACRNDLSRFPRLGTTEVVTANRYPWGEEWVDGRCNVASGGTTVVTTHPAGASAYGVEDLLGNVQEWTRTLWGSQPSQPDFAYPYDRADGREVLDPVKLPAQARLVHRGGSFKSLAADLRCTIRGNALPDSKIAWRGFRVAIVLS